MHIRFWLDSLIIDLELRKSLGKWNGYPLQYSCLENSMDRGAWTSVDCGYSPQGRNELERTE